MKQRHPIVVPILLLSGLVTAQGERVTPPPIRQETLGPVQPSRGATRQLHNRVVAVVGDRVYLEKELQAEFQLVYEADERGGTDVTTRAYREELVQTIMRKFAQEQVLAQSAKSVSGTSREALERMLEERLAEFRRTQEAEFGSTNEYARSLGELGRTWDGVREEQMTTLLAEFQLYQEVTRRLRDNIALMVTPSQMREWYDENRSRFVQPPSADVTILSFRATAGAADLEERLRLAAAAMAAPDADLEAIAEQYRAVVQVQSGVRASPDDPRIELVKSFATSTALGGVSDPVARGDSRWLMKVVAKTEGRNEPFESPAVHRQITEVLVNQMVKRLEYQLLERSFRTIYCMPRDLLRRM
jgi:hypothetical protein